MSVTVSCYLADIPQVAILTKIDEVSPEVKADLKNIYRDQTMKHQVCLITNISEYNYCKKSDTILANS